MTKYKAGLMREIEAKRPTDAPSAPPPATNSLVDPNAIARDVEAAIETKSALRQWRADYSDINDDPVLRDLADKYSAHLLTHEPGLTPAENLKKSGDYVREWIKSVGPQQAAGFDARRDNKRTTAAAAPAASSRASIGTDAPPPPTRSDVIAKMREQRGQPI